MTSTSPALNTTVSVTAPCPAGKVLLGGGGEAVNSDATQPSRVQLTRSRPQGTGWQATGVVDTGLGAANRMTVTAFAVCTV